KLLCSLAQTKSGIYGKDSVDIEHHFVFECAHGVMRADAINVAAQSRFAKHARVGIKAQSVEGTALSRTIKQPGTSNHQPATRHQAAAPPRLPAPSAWLRRRVAKSRRATANSSAPRAEYRRRWRVWSDTFAVLAAPYWRRVPWKTGIWLSRCVRAAS